MSSGPNSDRSPEDIQQLLEQHGILPPAPALTPEERRRTDAAGAAALARIVGSEPAGKTSRKTEGTGGASSGRRKTSRRRATREITAVLLGAAALVVGAVVLGVGGGDPGPRPSPPAGNGIDQDLVVATPAMVSFTLASNTTAPLRGRPASTVLRRLAMEARTAPSTGAGRYQLVTTESWRLATRKPNPNAVFIPTIARRYLQPDGRVTTVRRPGRALSKGGQLLASVSGPPGRATNSSVPQARVEYPSTLPTAPMQLAERLTQDCNAVKSACLAAQIVSLHENWVIDNKLEAGLWMALARRGDVRYLGLSQDRMGRRAEAFVGPSTAAGRQTLLLVAPSSGRLLDAETITASDTGGSGDGTKPRVTQFIAFVRSQRTPTLLRPMAGTR